MKSIVHAVPCLVLASQIVAPSVAGADQSNSTFLLKDSFIQLNASSSDACTSTSIFFEAVETVTHAAGSGPPGGGPSLVANFTVDDFCTGTTVSSPFAFLSFDPSDLVVLRDSATLQTTVTLSVCTEPAGTCADMPATITLALSPDGALFRENFHGRFDLGSGATFIDNVIATSQPASSTGSLTVGSLVIPLDSTSATYGRDLEGSILIVHP